MWLTPISGTPRGEAQALGVGEADEQRADQSGTHRDRDGGEVRRGCVPARSSASRTTGTMARKCSREASSGTTPPYLPCIAICDATTLREHRRAICHHAAAVSSQEDSMPRMRTTSTLARVRRIPE